MLVFYSLLITAATFELYSAINPGKAWDLYQQARRGDVSEKGTGKITVFLTLYFFCSFLSIFTDVWFYSLPVFFTFFHVNLIPQKIQRRALIRILFFALIILNEFLINK